MKPILIIKIPSIVKEEWTEDKKKHLTKQLNLLKDELKDNYHLVSFITSDVSKVEFSVVSSENKPQEFIDMNNKLTNFLLQQTD